MKAWMIGEYIPGLADYPFTILIHAGSRGKACALSMEVWPDLETPSYTNLRAVRVPQLDGTPFSIENVRDAQLYNQDGYSLDASWFNFCTCELCRPKDG